MRLSPLSPYLPRYPGPYEVGTIELELPVPPELQRTFGRCTVKTLLVRLFYPTAATHGKRPKWTGSGNYTIKGYARFLGLKESLLGAASYLGLKWTEIPAYSDVDLAQGRRRWPCMLFSHGLGGTRNAYSQVSGSIASGGVVVMAIEHRDNSAAISVVKTADGGEEVVDYVGIKDSTPSNIQKRRDQMAQRAYEVKLGLELFRSLDNGVLDSPDSPSSSPGESVSGPSASSSSSCLFASTASAILSRAPYSSFKGRLECEHGKMLIAGHSFGAATAVNVCKDTTTRLPPPYETGTLSTAFRGCILFDVWTEVLVDSNHRPLLVPTLGIVSQAFHHWSTNYDAVKLLLRRPHSASFADEQSEATSDGQSEGTSTTTGRQVPNQLIWIKESAHLAQSDFGILFPTATKYAFKATIDPRRAMDLNVRASRAFLRSLGVIEQPEDLAIFTSEQEVVVESLE